ncbi:thiosulfate:glutathione sulfurtransferase [Echeneis naucrates]|uniref:Thiosulfate:glutathione sulfurtransferase-like n=1 Tax=Echeneis naucrates TaxID=173247 RepID=A0A665V4U6_ECHNA|nr:thiosulfate:glutathione sulfurtransferase-like [Echeneis naucrates]
MKTALCGVRSQFVSVMFFCMLYRTACQVGSCRASASYLRAFATSGPRFGETNSDVSVVTYVQLKSMLFNRNIQLFDVRNPDEYQEGHISEAVNIPLDNLQESLKLSSEGFQEKFQVQAPGKEDDNIVFHCRSGKRSATALDIARQLGFTRARHYEGGYSEWEKLEGK